MNNVNNFMNRKWKKFLENDSEQMPKVRLTEDNPPQGLNRDQLQSEEARISFPIPKFAISETWGEPGTQDREIIEMFTSKIQGSTFAEKIESLQAFVNDCDQQCIQTKDVGEILGSLVYLDSLASVIYDFNDKTGGFLWESLFVVLLGGNARQVPTPGGPNQPIEDLLDSEDSPVSLKFLFAGPKYIKGSAKNLKVAIKKYKQPITYIVALKNRAGKEVLSIDFYSFTVGDRSQRGRRGNFDVKDLVAGIYTSDFVGKKYQIGTLNLGSRQKLVDIANKYAKRLGSVLLSVYQQIEDLSQNVNVYFVGDDKAAAIDAQSNAKTLKQEVDKL